MACKSHYGGVSCLGNLLLLFCSEPSHNLRVNLSSLLEKLGGSMKNNLEEGDGHREEHPDVDHLDVRGHREALGKSEETATAKNRMQKNKV